MRDELYYYEVVIMVLKSIVILACEVLTRISNEVQVLVAIIIFVVNLIVLAKVSPMSNDQANRMSLFS